MRSAYDTCSVACTGIDKCIGAYTQGICNYMKSRVQIQILYSCAKSSDVRAHNELAK